MATSTAFRFKSYSFTKVEMNMGLFSDETPMGLSFEPSGNYDSKSGRYDLKFVFKATQGEGEDKVSIIKIVCEAAFMFREPLGADEIPDYFYTNSLAIVFPYVRAFVSSVTLQANLDNPILLPTLNLMGLQSILREKTTLR